MKLFRVFLITVLIISAGCSPQAGRKILACFFDGVETRKIHDTTRDEHAALSSSETSHKADVVQVIKDSVHYHQPYRDNKCNLCHNFDEPMNKVSPQDDMCYSCHTNYPKKFEFLHKPVANGACTKCHSPHYSKNPSLLLNMGNELCLNCHTEARFRESDIHKKSVDRRCNECHDSHGGSNHYLLK